MECVLSILSVAKKFLEFLELNRHHPRRSGLLRYHHGSFGIIARFGTFLSIAFYSEKKSPNPETGKYGLNDKSPLPASNDATMRWGKFATIPDLEIQ